MPPEITRLRPSQEANIKLDANIDGRGQTASGGVEEGSRRVAFRMGWVVHSRQEEKGRQGGWATPGGAPGLTSGTVIWVLLR